MPEIHYPIPPSPSIADYSTLNSTPNEASENILKRRQEAPQPGQHYSSTTTGSTKYGHPYGSPLQPSNLSLMSSGLTSEAFQNSRLTSTAANPSLSSHTYSPHAFDTTGQIAPPGKKPRVTATLWEDEGSLCFQVEAKGVCVARREDNHMINGTKLLNVAGMTRRRRDGILKAEKVRHIVKIGPMHLKGVWIPFERALEFANKEKITEQLYPLFVHDVGALLYHPSNQTRSNARGQSASSASLYGSRPASTQPPYQHHHRTTYSPTGTIGGGLPTHVFTPHPSSGRPGLDRANTFPTPPTSASSIMGMGSNQGSSHEWSGTGIPNQPLSIDTGIANAQSLPTTPATTPPASVQAYPAHTSHSTTQPYGVATTNHLYLPSSTTSVASDISRYHSHGVKRGRDDGDDRSTYHQEQSPPMKSGRDAIQILRGVRKNVMKSDAWARNLQHDSEDIDMDVNRLRYVAQGHPRISNAVAEVMSSQESDAVAKKAENQPFELGEEERLLIQLRDEESTPWPDIAKRFSTDFGKKYQIPALQMRLKRLRERMREAHVDKLSEGARSIVSDQDVFDESMFKSQGEEGGVSLGPAEHAEAAQPERSPAPNTTDSEPTTASTDSGQYSLYDDSSEEENNDISSRKQRVINSVMLEFYRMFDATFGVACRASGQSNSAQGSLSGFSKASGSSTASRNQLNKRKRDDGDQDNEEQEDGKRKRQKGDKNSCDDLEDDRKLACPYFKHNPRKYRNVHSCLGPGFVTIHRLKEHLYRRHALPPHCTRCCETFKSEPDLIAHSRRPEGCNVQDQELPEGFDKVQEKLLKSRKKGSSRDSIAEQWKDIYEILFPDVDRSDIPSPYYDYGEDANQADQSPTSAGFARYDAYLRRELPNTVRQEVEKEMEEEFNNVDEKLKSRLPMIVRNCLERLCRAYQTDAHLASEVPHTALDSSVNDGSEPPQAGPSQGRGSSLSIPGSSEDHLAALSLPPEIAFPEAFLEKWDDFFPCSNFNGDEPSDSGYGSLDQNYGIFSSMTGADGQFQSHSFGCLSLPDLPQDYSQDEDVRSSMQFDGQAHDDVETEYSGKGKLKQYNGA